MGFKKLEYILDGNLSVFQIFKTSSTTTTINKNRPLIILSEVYQLSSLKQSEYFGIQWNFFILIDSYNHLVAPLTSQDH